MPVSAWGGVILIEPDLGVESVDTLRGLTTCSEFAGETGYVHHRAAVGLLFAVSATGASEEEDVTSLMSSDAE
jgi:hypothetical protein